MWLSKRSIAVFADAEYTSLESLLKDSKIFANSKIIKIHKNDLSKAAKETIFLVHWKDFKDKIDDILRMKADQTVLIIYAPQHEGRVEPQSVMDQINSHRNTIVVNFRGRLMNDILVSLITTSYDS